MIHSASSRRLVTGGEGGHYILQDLLFGVIPNKAPSILMLMVAQRDQLYPMTPVPGAGKGQPRALAERILPALLSASQARVASAPPAQKDPANLKQFLISRNIDFQNPPSPASGREGVMPELKGLSLRKGLQLLNSYHLMVNVEGSGRIVGQNPPAGSPLQGVGECTLTLEGKKERVAQP
jgi:cell division protein FtsI (penicillin-binding protein 3)